MSYVDDCSWAVSFSSQNEFQEQASHLLGQVSEALEDHGPLMDEGKTEVAWIFAGERPRTASREKAREWALKW